MLGFIIGLFLGLFNSDVRMIFFINNQLLVKNSIEKIIYMI